MIHYPHSLARRLTLWYAGVFGLCFLSVFGAFYFIMSKHFHRWTDEELREEVVEVHMAYGENGAAGVVQQLKEEEASEGERFMGRLINASGAVVIDTSPEFWGRIPVCGDDISPAGSGEEEINMIGWRSQRAVRAVCSLLPDGSVVQIGLTLLDHEIWMRTFAGNTLKVALLALVLSVSAGGVMAHRALAPLGEMARKASGISGRSMGKRMPSSGGGDEVDQLASAFNGMLDRIDTLIEGLRNVTDMLAHDLRTPITGIRGMAEVILNAPREPGAYRMALYRIMEQLDRLLALSSFILDVSEVESGALVLKQECVSMEDLATEVVQTFEPVAQEKGIRLERRIPQGVAVVADRGRVRQVMANLLDNAIKYTPPGGDVRFSLEADALGVRIVVADTGVGIPEQDLPHIFERYYRGDKSRSGEGAGLGLPLVQGIVHAHEGHVIVETQVGKGSVFKVFFPSTPCN